MRKKLYVCRRCALQAPTCCRLGADQTDGGGGEDCFPLSDSERGRIEAALAAGHCPGGAGWHVPEANSARFVQAMRGLFPGEKARLGRIFPQGGLHTRLSLRPDGGCVFLSAQGCALPVPARPGFCRIFPFWVAGGSVQCFKAEDCLAVFEHRGNRAALLEEFGVSPREILELYAALRHDWGLD